MEPRYKIMPDEVQANKFRVAYAGSEYTVQFKRQYQHGLTKRQANSILRQLEAKRENAIDRLIALLAEYDEIDPQSPEAQRATVNRLSAQYRIATKSISTALLMRAGGINVVSSQHRPV